MHKRIIEMERERWGQGSRCLVVASWERDQLSNKSQTTWPHNQVKQWCTGDVMETNSIKTLRSPLPNMAAPAQVQKQVSWGSKTISRSKTCSTRRPRIATTVKSRPKHITDKTVVRKERLSMKVATLSPKSNKWSKIWISGTWRRIKLYSSRFSNNI